MSEQKNSFESAMDFASIVIFLIMLMETIIYVEYFFVWFFTKACPFIGRVCRAFLGWTAEAICRVADWTWNTGALVLGRATIRFAKATVRGLEDLGRGIVWIGWKTAIGVRYVWINYI